MTDRPVALVTGASRGLGAAAAIALGRRGAHVVLAARTVGGLEAADDAIRAGGGSASILPLDLAHGDTLDLLGPTLLARFGRLDAWVSAAAALPALTPLAHLRDADWGLVTTLVLDANRRLIRSLDPLLRRAPAGRAVFLLAPEAAGSAPFWGAYAVAKAGLATMMRLWAAETAGTPLRITGFTPPPTATALRARAYPGQVAGLARPEDSAAAIAALALPGPLSASLRDDEPHAIVAGRDMRR